jgi:hypothetical protein
MDSISNCSFNRRFFDKSHAKFANNNYINGGYNEYLIKNEEMMNSHNRFFQNQIQNGIYQNNGYNQLVYNSAKPNYPNLPATPAHIFNRQPIVSFSQTSAPFMPNGFTTPPPPSAIHPHMAPTLTHHSFQILASSSPISLNNTSNNIILNQNVLSSNRFKMRPNQSQNGEQNMLKAKNVANNTSNENSFTYENNPQFYYNQNPAFQIQQSPQFLQQQQLEIQQIQHNQQQVHPSQLNQSQIYYNSISGTQTNGSTSPNMSQTSLMNQQSLNHNMIDDSVYSANGNQSSLNISNSSTNPQVNQSSSYMHAMY